MSANTKIVVLHMKELIYTVVFSILGILLLVLLITLFLPEKNQTQATISENATTPAAPSYIPGIYTTELILGQTALGVEVITTDRSIASLELTNIDDKVTTMYPLILPTFKHLRDQIYEQQSLANVTYENDAKYTSMLLLEAIQNSISKATDIADKAPAEVY